MSKKTGVIVTIIAVIALCLAAVDLGILLKRQKQENETAGETKDVQYVMYLGTNDKDSNELVFDTEEAKEQAKQILIDHFGGYTIQEANGGWIDDGTVYQEYTLVIYLSDTNEIEVHKAADDLLKVFNQSSVLIQTNETSTEFYSGNE